MRALMVETYLRPYAKITTIDRYCRAVQRADLDTMAGHQNREDLSCGIGEISCENKSPIEQNDRARPVNPPYFVREPCALAARILSCDPNLADSSTKVPHSFPEVPHSFRKVPHSDAEASHSAANVAHSPAAVPHSPATVPHSPATVPHSPANVAHSPANLAHSPANDAHSPANVAHSRADVSLSTAKLAHSSAKVAHWVAEHAHSSAEDVCDSSKRRRGRPNAVLGAAADPEAAARAVASAARA